MSPIAVIPCKTHCVYTYLSVNIRLDIRYKDVSLCYYEEGIIYFS